MFPRVLSVLVCASTTVLFASHALAGTPRPVVVELFTSQGCSSCPPADRYLSELSDSRADVLPLAFHVTYWNQLGWKDPFSLSAADARQAQYVERFQSFAYTPELVIDGSVTVVGSNADAAAAAIAHAKASDATVAIVDATRDGDFVSISIGRGSGQATVLLVGYDSRHVTTVGHGENAGRTLTESNAVRAFAPIGQWSGSPLALRTRTLPGERLAVLLEGPDGAIVGAARVTDEQDARSR